MQCVGNDIVAHHHMTACLSPADTATDSPPHHDMHAQSFWSKRNIRSMCDDADSQFEHSRALPQHHLDKVPVVDGIAVATGHLNDHFFQLQVGLGHAEFLHHPLQTHQI